GGGNGQGGGGKVTGSRWTKNVLSALPRRTTRELWRPSGRDIPGSTTTYSLFVSLSAGIVVAGFVALADAETKHAHRPKGGSCRTRKQPFASRSGFGFQFMARNKSKRESPITHF